MPITFFLSGWGCGIILFATPESNLRITEGAEK